MSDKIYTLDEIKSIAAPIARQYGVAAMYLFGSYARGEQNAESDIDILLTADLTQEQIAETRRAVAALSSDLSLDHEVTVSIQIVPLTQFRRYADFLPFYQNILKEGIRYAS